MISAAKRLQTQEYESLTAALIEVRGDSHAAATILGSDQPRVAGWLESAHRALRGALVNGRLEDGEALGEAIGSVLRAQEDGSNDELAENRIHSECLRSLVAGIGEINNRDLAGGVAQLEGLTESVYCSESLQWIAWLWVSKAAAEQGDIPRALDSAAETLALAKSLDEAARSVSLGNAAEVRFLAGDHAQALEHLAAATASFEMLGDIEGLSKTWVARARIEVDRGEEERAAESAARAREVDPANEEALVFLASQALVQGDVSQARAILTPAVQQDAPSAEIVREMRIAALVGEGELGTGLLREYYRLRGRPPAEGMVVRVRELVHSHPDFLQLRELLAWSLTRLGADEEAATHFEVLMTRAAGAELQRSALLGLGCLANRRHPHRQPGRWIRAAAAAGSDNEDRAAGDSVDVELEAFDADELDEAMDLLIEEEPMGRQTVPAELWHELQLDDLQEMPAEPPEPVAVSESSSPTAEHAVVREQSRRPTVEQAAVSPPRAAFTGQLQTLAPADLLDFLKASRRTGTLVLTSDDGMGAVHLRKGLITSAASPNCTSIGSLLLQEGLLDEGELAKAASAQQSEEPDRLLGALLVANGLVEESALRSALEKQVLSAIIELAQWTTGSFVFESDKQGGSAPVSEIDVEFDTQGILLDALRAIDEQSKD